MVNLFEIYRKNSRIIIHRYDFVLKISSNSFRDRSRRKIDHFRCLIHFFGWIFCKITNQSLKKSLENAVSFCRYWNIDHASASYEV